MDALLKRLPISIKINSLTVVILALIIGFGFYNLYTVHQQVYQNFYRQSALSAAGLTNEVAPSVWMNNGELTRTIVKSFANTPYLVFIRMNDTGNKRLDGFNDSIFDSTVEEITATGNRVWESDSVLALRNRIIYNKEVLGFTIVGFSKTEIVKSYHDHVAKTAIIGGGLALLLIIFSFLITRSITNPIKKARQELENNLANASDFSIRLPEKGGKELFEFSQAFNQLAEAAEENWLQLYQQLPNNQGFFSDNPIPMIITDPFWNIRNANKAARQRLTGTEDPLQDRNLEDFLLSNDMAGMIEQIRESDDNLRNTTVTLKNNAGSKTSILIDVVLLRNEFYAVTDYLLILHDLKPAFPDDPQTRDELAALKETYKSLQNHDLQLRDEVGVERHQRQRLERLIRAAEKLVVMQDAERIYQALQFESTHLLGCKGSAVFLWDENSERLLPFSPNAINGVAKSKTLRNSGGIVWNALKTQKIQYLTAIDEATYEEVGFSGSEAMAMMAIPMILSSKKFGVIVYWRDAEQPFISDEDQFISLLIHNAIVALDRCDLQKHPEISAEAGENSENLQKSLQDAFQQQKMESLEILVGGIAHDFNNILGIITPNVDLLRMKLDGNTEAIKRVNAIQTATKRATDLTRQMVIFTQSDQLNLRAISPNRIIERVATMLQRAFGDLIKVELALDAKIPGINGDESKLAQALVNLSVNARDAMPRGGTLTFRTTIDSYSQPGEATPPQKYVRITVEDTGIGIPEKHLFNIFDPFFTTKPPRKGTGLGLAVVYGIIKSHGGFITVESEENKGSKFHIFIEPVARKKAQQLPPQPKTSSEPATKGTPILIVDDEPLVRESLRDLLNYLGYRVYEAEGGREAMQLFDKHREINIAIVDFAMPQMSGIETIRGLRSMDQSLKIILSSGYADQEKAVSRHKGIQAFLHKPIHLEKLSEVMESVLQTTA